MGYSKQVTYNTIGTAVSLFCQWLIIMLIPRITDFTEAGVFAVAVSICSILNIFATFSLNQYQISDQYVNYGESEYHTSRLLTISLSFILCMGCIIFFGYSAEQNFVIIGYMVYRNLIHYAYLYTATLQIHERLDYVGKCTITEGVVSLLSFVSVYTATRDLALSVAVMAVLGGGLFMLCVAAGHKKEVGKGLPRPSSDRRAVRHLIRLGIPLLISGVAPIIITALPKLMLQAADGNEAAGIFSTLSAPTIIIPTLMIGLFTPFIVYFSNVSRSGDMRLLRKQYVKTSAVLLGLGSVCYAISYFAGEYFFELLYGKEILPYVGYFGILIIGITFYSIGTWGITVLMTKEQGRSAAAVTMLSLAASAVLFFAVIPEYGIDGATYGLLAAYGIFGFLISIFVLALPLDKAVR